MVIGEADARPIVRVRIYYQADPGGLIPGGIDTFIQGIVRYAPSDIRFSIVGLTTDASARPVGHWTDVSLGRASVAFFPVGVNPDPGGRSRIPLSVRLTAGILRYFAHVARNCDVLDFHRIEPALPFVLDGRPKNAYIHQNMEVLRGDNVDIRWSRCPGLYFLLEGFALRRFASIFCVREDAAGAYRRRYPEIAERVRFVPTWLDPETFHPPPEGLARQVEGEVRQRYGIRADEPILVSVGRLDQQKNPTLLIRSFALVAASRANVKLVMVGDGVLRETLKDLVDSLGLQDRVVFAGLRPAGEIADLLRAATAFVMTSAYEGMPISVLEAMGCGVPVIATDVGEIARVVKRGINGELVRNHAPDEVAAAIGRCLDAHDRYAGAACVRAVQDFVPERVLASVYETYRALARARAS